MQMLSTIESRFVDNFAPYRALSFFRYKIRLTIGQHHHILNTECLNSSNLPQPGIWMMMGMNYTIR